MTIIEEATRNWDVQALYASFETNVKVFLATIVIRLTFTAKVNVCESHTKSYENFTF